MDLRRVSGSAGLRRLWALVSGLPPQAAVWHKEAWTTQDELLATLVEQSDSNARALIHAWTGKAPSGKPLKIERPGGEEPKRPAKPSPESIERFSKAIEKRR